MKSVLAIAFLLCLVALSVEGYFGYGGYFGLGGLDYGYGGYRHGGYYGIPHYGPHSRRLFYNPIHGLHSHGSYHDYDHPIY
uniref:Prismalin-14-like n=1 Tax=Crassostrea virginica TaxID=6565 RepID=A0A8B8C9B0_CRAVI|nr:prismalin-14-like [Crassostrea virginica]